MSKGLPAMQNQFVEYAQRDEKSRKIAEFLDNLKNALDSLKDTVDQSLVPFEFTGTNYEELFEKKPLFISYGDYVMVLQENDVSDELFYSCIFDNHSASLYVTDSGTVTLTETELAKESDIPVVKPIYCHPVYFYKSQEYRCMTLIFTNDGTPFTPTTLADWVEALYTQVGDAIRVILNGGFKDSNDTWCVATHFGKNTTGFYLSGVSMSGANSSFSGLTKQQFINIVTEGFDDGVNLIN